jgi:hypothetical protein
MAAKRNWVLAAAVAVVMSVIGVALAEKDPSAPAKTADPKPPTAELLLGAWALAGEPGAVQDPKEPTRLKFFGHRHWVITQSDSATGAVVFHHGGTYTLENGKYVEKITFATDGTASLVGKEFRFTLKIDGDTLTQLGEGNPWNEVWKRPAK